MITKKGMITKLVGEKTIKVEVHDQVAHPKYHKRYRKTKQYLVHTPAQEGKVGDYVLIEQCRPVSKRKSFTLHSIITPAVAA